MKVPFGFLDCSDEGSSPSSPCSPSKYGLVSLLWLSRLEDVVAGHVGEVGSSPVAILSFPSLKIWMVSEADETQSSVVVTLKAMLYIREGIEPLLNWYSLLPSGTEKTRIMVPLSDAVAIIVPSLLNIMQDSGDLCASTTLIASSFEASNSRISPEVGEI